MIEQLSLDLEPDRPPGSESAYLEEIGEGIFLHFDAEDRAIAVEAKHGTAIDRIESLANNALDRSVNIGQAIDTTDGYTIYRIKP